MQGKDFYHWAKSTALKFYPESGELMRTYSNTQIYENVMRTPYHSSRVNVQTSVSAVLCDVCVKAVACMYKSLLSQDRVLGSNSVPDFI